ncbi:hypothetical protein RHS02_09061, partial [Rhizoctonia solani]
MPTCLSLQASSHAGCSYPTPTMATHSQTASQAQSPFDQGDLGPQLPTMTTLKIGEVSLKQVTQLLLGLLRHVKCLEQEVQEIKEAGIKTHTNIENISQANNVVKDGLRSLRDPQAPKDTKPRAVEETPHPLPKAKPIGLASKSLGWAKPPQSLPAFAMPTPIQAAPPQVPSPPSSLPYHLCSLVAPTPLAPAAQCPTPMKVNHPNAYTSKIGSKAKQWLTWMLAWTCLNSQMFPINQETLSYLLINMKGVAKAWAHPHLDQLGSHQAIIQIVMSHTPIVPSIHIPGHS